MNARERVRGALLRAAGRGLATPRTSGAAPRRLLLIRPDHLGDVLWLTPALRALRERFPDAHLTVAAGPWGQPVLAGNPDIDAILPVDFPGFTRRPKGGPLAPYAYLREVAREVRGRRFDAALVLRDDHWWGALLAATAGIPRRFGYALPDVAPFLTDALPPPPRRHAALDNFALLDAVLSAAGRPPILGSPHVRDGAIDPAAFPLVFAPARDAGERVDALLASHNRDAAGNPSAPPLVAIHPSAGVPVKL